MKLIAGILNPSIRVLPAHYEGAYDALNSRNPDRARHVLTSLRETWWHLLRRLAPDNLVNVWLPKKTPDFWCDKGPTRKARVEYICRNVDCRGFSDFVVKDTKALIKLLKVFNQIHKLDLELQDKNLKALLLKSDSWIVYILQIEEEIN